MDGKTLRDYARLGLELQKLEDDVKAKKKEIKDAEGAVLKAFQRDGIKKVTLADDRTVYLRREVQVSRAKGLDAEAFHAKLRELELGDFVTETVPAGRLKSYVKEHEEEEKKLDPKVAELLSVHEQFKVIVLQKGAKLNDE